MGSVSKEQRELPEGVTICERTGRKMWASKAYHDKYIKAGNGFLDAFVPAVGDHFYDDPGLLPDGAVPDDFSKFKDIWKRFDRQLQATNGMDLDTFPGPSMVADAYPLNLSNITQKEYALMVELAELAFLEYNNEPSNVFTYKYLTIEKGNSRLTGYLEYFMTVKATNLTLGIVVETFEIHAGKEMGRGRLKVFSCLPKGGALDAMDAIPSWWYGEQSVAKGKGMSHEF